MEQPILVIDEPTSQLDPETTNAMFELIAAARKQGKTIILVEHKMEKVAEFSDRIVVMHDGEILLEGTPAEVFSDPRCEQAGIRMPESMYLRRALDRKGLRLSESPLSVESLINDLEHRYGRPSASEFTVGQSKSPLFATPLLSIRDVEFSYPNGVKAVDQVSIDIAAGESVGIIGQNGAGKTTLAKLVNGLLKPSGGEIVIGGESTASWTAAQTARRVGYVFQNPDDQIFNKTVEDEVGYALTRLRFSADERATLITNALNLCGLSDHRNVNPYDLPPSIRKFVTIASVIALAPDVIILDEPTAGQDLVGLNRLITILQALKEQGKAILTITHDMEFVSQNFMRTIVMANRQVISDMPTSAVFYNKEILNEAMVNQPAFVQLSSHFADERIGLSMSRFAALFTPESAQQP